MIFGTAASRKNEVTATNVIVYLDEPYENKLSWSRVLIRGWALPPNKIKWIEVTLNGEFAIRVGLGTEIRPDLAIAYPSIPNAEMGGFNALLELGHKEATRALVISARTIDGNLYHIAERPIMNSRSAIDLPPSRYCIGLISCCNLSCTMCPAHSNNSNFIGKYVIDQRLLDVSLIGLEHFSSNIKRVGLTGWGEPFMYEHIFQVIDRVHQVCPNARISITTNGTMFSNEIIQKILDSQLTDIAISLDAGSKTTFEKIRKGANFDKVLEDTRSLVNTRNRLGRKTPIISTNFVLMRSNIHELADYVRTAIHMGVDLIGTVHAFGLFDSDRSEAIYTTPARQGKINNDYSNFIKEAQNVAKKGNSKLYLPPLKPSEPRLDCSFSARQLPIIDPSGDVYPCCVLQALGNEKGTSVRPMGNIYLESLPDIWNSSSYSQFREAFYTGHLPSQSCEKCPKYYSL